MRTSSLERFVVGASTSDEWDDATLSEGDGLIAAVQGRIDNLPELTAHLSRAGVDPGPSPADVVRALFLREGERTPERLRGVYAIVLSDGLRLWCFRDHLGFATLFYRTEREGIYVASEAKQVVAAAGIPWRPDPDVAHIILHRDYDDDTPAAIRGVSRLPKMTILSAEPGRVRRRRYWRPEQLLETARYSRGELQERFDELGEFFRPVGCGSCANTGYRGRIGLYEVMPMSEEIERLTVERASAETVKRLAVEQGMRTLREDGLEKASAGITTIEEIARVVS